MNDVKIDQPALVHYDTSDLEGVVAEVLRTRDGDVRQLVVRVLDDPSVNQSYLVRFVPFNGSWRSTGGHSTLTV